MSVQAAWSGAEIDFVPISASEMRDGGGAEDATGALAQALTYVLSRRGKGIRPTIVWEAARCGPEYVEEIVRHGATAVELLHIATIAHDDLLDGAQMRRGAPSVSIVHGNVAAAESGVWLLGRFVEIMAGLGPSILRRGADCVSQMCAGQLSEVQDIFNLERTSESYLYACRGKTAALFEFAAGLGAELAGAPNVIIEKLRLYGRELGVAFQIADDVLDLIADEDATGKSAGSDARQGVYTLPLLYALETEPRLRQLLLAGGVDLTRSIAPLVQASGGIGRASADCRRHLTAAKRAVASLAREHALAAVAEQIGEQLEEASA